MGASWSRFCRGRDLEVEEPHVLVKLAQGRHHRVTIDEADDAYVMTAVILRPAAAAAVTDLPLLAWRRNRAVSLAGFRLDSRGRLIGDARAPKAGLTAEEFQVYLRNLAAEADQFEYALTGKDVE